MIDEIHFISDSSRGAIMESMISRIITLSHFKDFEGTSLHKIRIIGLSATLQNYDEFAEYLNVNKTLRFGERYRPV